MPTRGMYDTWISGSDVDSFCCYGLVYLLDSWYLVFEKPSRSSYTFTHMQPTMVGGGVPQQHQHSGKLEGGSLE
jgi:hypothetical protein